MIIAMTLKPPFMKRQSSSLREQYRQVIEDLKNPLKTTTTSIEPEFDDAPHLATSAKCGASSNSGSMLVVVVFKGFFRSSIT
jgi:hypothetical protein